MSGRGGRNFSRGGRGNGGRGHGRGRDQKYTGNTTTTKKGLCKALGGNVFDCGQKAAADQMQKSWDKISTEYAGSLYGQDISNELQNKTTVDIAKPSLQLPSSFKMQHVRLLSGTANKTFKQLKELEKQCCSWQSTED